jgi:hypothetical protein
MASITPVSDFAFFLQLVGAPGGPRAGLRRQIIKTVKTKKRLSSIPGNIPATKSLPMDSKVKNP